MTTAADWLKLVGVVVATVAAVLATVWAVVRPHFRDAVLEALKSNGPAFKEWNDENNYADTLREIMSTTKLAEQTHDALLRLIETVAQQGRDLARHQERVEAQLLSVVEIRPSIDHLATAVQQLNATVSTVVARNQAHEIELAVLKDRDKRGG